MADVFLSVVVPAYNEERNFQKGSISRMLTYLEKQSYVYEVVFVDDGSSDNTANMLEDLAKLKSYISVIKNDHGGKAQTVATGMLKAKGENRIYTDFDQSTPMTEVGKLLPFRERGYDVVIGSREVKGAKREAEPIHRHLMGKVFNLVVKIFTVRGIQDTQCGFKLFSAKATQDLFPKLKVTNKPKKDAFTGAFDVELLFLAQKQGYRIAEVPVDWHHEKTERVSPLKDAVRMFMEVVKIRTHDIFSGY